MPKQKQPVETQPEASTHDEEVAQAIAEFDAAYWNDCYPQARRLRDLLARFATDAQPVAGGGE